jgi:hypothetical protein
VKKHQWVKDCWDYHSQHISELDVAVDWGNWDSEYSRCWCCGHTGKLQKCHIIPKSLGGDDIASNFVPLCSQCHDEAPDVMDKVEMFRWIKDQQNPLCGLGLGRYWHVKDILLNKLGHYSKEFNPELFNQCLNNAYDKSSFHCSQSNAGIKFKKSTREWTLNKAFDLYEKESNCISVPVL